jgi:hypothetical protein
MARRLTGPVSWTRGKDSRMHGMAVVLWHDDGRLTMDLTEGQFRYGAEIEATSDRGRWRNFDEGWEGTCSASLIRGGRELSGQWSEGGEVYHWQIEFQEITELPKDQ